MRWFLLLGVFILLCIEISDSGSLGPDDVLVTLNLLLDARTTCVYQYMRNNLLMHLLIDPATNVRVEVQLTYPSGKHREIIKGTGSTAYMKHNVKEKGDYEICIMTPSPVKVLYHMYAYDTEAFEERERLRSANNSADHLNTSISKLSQNMLFMEMAIKTYNQVSVRDVNLQLKNSAFIMRYVIGFCFSAIIVAILQVSSVRRMFYINPSRIRI